MDEPQLEVNAHSPRPDGDQSSSTQRLRNWDWDSTEIGTAELQKVEEEIVADSAW